MDGSPHLESRSSRTTSLRIDDNDGESTVIIGTSLDDEEMRYSPNRKDALNTVGNDSFNSYTTRPPPTSPTDTNPLTAFEKHDTLPVVNDPTSVKVHVQTMLAPGTPPKSAQRTRNSSTAGPSPSRALSLPMDPVHRTTLTEGTDGDSLSPHRVTSAMAKRSANPGPARKVAPLPSSSRTGPSPSKAGTSRKGVIQEDEYGADDEGVPSNESTQAHPLVATQSMPDLRESPQRPFPVIAFLPNLIENQKRAVKALPPVIEASPGRSTADTEASSESLASQKFEYYSRYARKQEKVIFRPLTQKPMGENPPGITVHSQSQSDHDYARSSGDYHVPDDRDLSGSLERRATTLVVGTPSETSESSQPDRELDMSQLYREGRSFMPDADEEELVPTQVVADSQDIETLPLEEEVAVTQSVHEYEQTLSFSAPGTQNTLEFAAQTMVKTIDVSPRKAKPKGFYSSSSGTSQSIPGLSNPDNSGSFGTKPATRSPGKKVTQPDKDNVSAKPNPISVYQHPAKPPQTSPRKTLTRTGRPSPLLTSRPMNTNIPKEVAVPGTVRPFGTLASADKQTNKKPAPTLKRGPGLMRRKTPPAAVDLWLAEREAKMLAEETATTQVPQDDETLPVDHPEGPPAAREEEEETQSLGFYSRLRPKEDEHTLEVAHDQRTASYVTGSGDEGSMEMETDEEPVGKHTPKVTSYRWRASPEQEAPANITPKPNTNGIKPKVFLLAGLTRNRSESIEEQPIPRADSAEAKGSNTTTVAVNTPVEWNHDKEDEESSSSSADDDDTSDYNFQETQTQEDRLEKEAIIEGAQEEEDEDLALFRPIFARPGPKNKRQAKNQGGRDSKRVCRRTESWEERPVNSAPKSPLKARRGATTPGPSKLRAQKPELPTLVTSTINRIAGAPSARTTRAAQNRARTGSNAVVSPGIGHLVLVRYAEARRYFFGYAIVRTGKLWEIIPADGSPTVYSEPRYMREGVFRVDDPVIVSADSGGENCGDAIVIAVDEHWDENRSVKVLVGAEGDTEERYVAIRHLSVEERNIKHWDDRKVTHKDLESEEAMETMSTSTSAALNLRESFTIPTPGRNVASSIIRTSQAASGKMFSGIGFVLTNCDDATTKRIAESGGCIYTSWLNAFHFDGAFENVKGLKGQQRWIRRPPGVNQGKGKSRVLETPPLQWIGNEDEQGVKTMFLIAGKVVMTAKTLISLALGIPCVSHQWVEACELEGKRVGWFPYLLPSHNLPSPLAFIPNALPSQAPDYQWGSDPHFESPVLESILNYRPLAHRRILNGNPRVLYIAQECIQKLTLDYDKHVDAPPCQVPFMYCCLAMGAQHVEAVEQYTHATDKTLSTYDLVIVADT
ncbi:hypothetical protein M408DRAFT_334357, partial [Serendipita vermifera MAFF 305830]